MAIFIDKITFENYRQYGTGSLSFRTDGEVKLSVMVAKNGTGKTTLLNAITWCLYGKEHHLADNETALPVLNMAAMRQGGNGATMRVTVALTILDGDNVVEFKRYYNYLVKRDATGSPKAVRGAGQFEVAITPRGQFENTVVKQGADAEVIVKQYFDEAIFRFYFFDGEKLSDYFARGQADTIKQSVFNISQVTMLKRACDRLWKMATDRTKKLAKDNPDIAKLTEEKEKTEKRRDRAVEELADAKSDLAEYTQKREQVDELLRGYEPVKKLQAERVELEASLKSLENEEEQLRIDRTQFIRQYYTILVMYPRIKHTLDIIHQKEKDGDLPPAIDKAQVQRLLAHLDEPCPLCNGVIGESGRQHLLALMDSIAVSSHTSNYLKEIKAPLESYAELALGYPKKRDEFTQKDMDISARKKKAEERLKEIASLLAHFESETQDGKKGAFDVANAENNRSLYIQKVNEANQRIGAAYANIESCKDRLTQIDREIELAMKKMQEHAEIQRQLIAIKSVWERFSKISTEIVDEMKLQIEKTTWQIFDAMIWKQQTFGGVKISDSYEVTVLNKDGLPMTGSLGATELMALAYAFTLAIHKASGKNCPLVIDSPLGRVSDENRENMAAALREVSKEKQIIMLFTPDEYSAPVQKLYNGVADVRELTLSTDESHVEGIDH